MVQQTSKIKEEINAGTYNQKIKDIYVDEGMTDYQKNRYVKAVETFEELYGESEVEIYSAPGRSEVGGNHTDHQLGKVIATSLNLDAIAVVKKTEEAMITIYSQGYGEVKVSLDEMDTCKEEEGTTKALIKGVAAKLKADGYEIGGFIAYVTSDVLNGAGMSSSAAFEVLVGTILSGLYNDMKISPIVLAQVGQYAENVYFGKPCGLMDQMACSVGGLINIDFEDTKNPKVHQVEVDFETYHHSLCIVDTKGSHADLTDDYAAIPTEMKEVAKFFGKEVLRQVDEEEFFQKMPEVREQLGDRPVLRTLHLFEENKRVDAQVEALEHGEFDTFKNLIKASGDSSFKFLQNVYTSKDVNNQSVSIGLAVSETILKESGVCRVHGGGFAGTIQAFVPDELVAEYKEKVEHVFGVDSCHILKVRKYGGMKVL